MLYDIGLIASVATGGWLALDVAMAESWRRRSIALGVLGLTGALWAGTELMLRVADAPQELAMLRRLLYLAVAGASFSWYWVSLEADTPRWFRRYRALALLPLVPLGFTWSCLWWAPDGTVISLYSREPSHGPLWIVSAGTNWALIVAGLLHYGRAVLRLRRRDRTRAHALAVGMTLPLVLNVAYALRLVPFDPAPCLLGPAALLIRFALVDIGLTGFLPLARKDVLEQLEVGVLVADADGHVMDANASARRSFGGRSLSGEPLEPLCRELPPTTEVLRFPLESHAGHPGMAAVLTDRSAAVEAERRLQLASRLEAIGSLTAGIAHEVNNPLAYISTNLNVLEKLIAELDRCRLDEPLVQRVREGAESLTDVQDGFERISLLVARLKGFARQPEGPEPDAQPPEVDLAEVARKAAAVAGVGLAPGSIRIGGAPQAPLPVREDVVSQILVNLILNAVQSSGSRPEVEVEVEGVDGGIEIRVADRGPGLAPETLDRIFDPFFTTKRSGTGLGLSISFDLARRLDGRIDAANREGGGAVFTLWLPATAGQQPADQPG